MPKFKDIKKFTKFGSWECDFTFKYFIEFIDEHIQKGYDNFTMTPDFQRGNVWTEEQQIAYIEFLIKGGSTAKVIYLNVPDWGGVGSRGNYNEGVCMDGLQRYTAIKRFMNNEIKVFGYYLDEYEDKDTMLWNSNMKINVNNLKSRAEVLQWYIDYNSGGTVHSEEEINRVRKLLEEEESK